MEMWKTIKDYPNYLISSCGKIYNKTKHKMLKPIKCNDYFSVFLFNNHTSSKHYIHRLVAETFLINKHGKKVVNHKDGNKLNNCVDNLEWATYKENTQHAIRTGLIKRNSKNKKVEYYFRKKYIIKRQCHNGETIYYKNIYDAREKTGMSVPYIQFLLFCDNDKSKEKWLIVSR